MKKSTRPLKVLPLDTNSEPSPAKPFLKFRRAERGFVLNPNDFVGFNTKLKRFGIFLGNLFPLYETLKNVSQ
jgi:hypothetical protein